MLVALLYQTKRPTSMEALPRILGNSFFTKAFSEKCEAVFGIKNALLKPIFSKSVKRFSGLKMRC